MNRLVPNDMVWWRSPIQFFSVLAIVCGLYATLKGFLLLDGFWEDEFFQIAFLNEGLSHFFVQVARLDQHPPFHFLQLKFWGLFFDSDRGLLLNSVIWHLISCVVLFGVGRAWLGTKAALLAVAFYALLPQVVSSSVSLRMYAMIPALALGTWWLNIKLLSESTQPGWRVIALVGTELALGYSHAIAIYFIAWFALAAAAQVYYERGKDAAWRRWFITQGGAAILLLPLVASVLMRMSMPGQGSESGGNSDMGSVVTHLGGMVAGWGMNWEYGKPVGAVFFALAVAFGVWRKSTRVVALCLLVGPYLVATVIGLLFAPMFKTPVYSAMLMPFACLALAGGLLAHPSRVQTWGAAALVVLMMVAVLPTTSYLLERTSPYKPIAAELSKRVQPGDVVVIPKPYLYWAVMRYAVAPDWGSPLEVLPPLSENWQRLLAKLGPELTSLLKLQPKTNQVVHQGVTYVIGEDAIQATAHAQRVWEIRRLRYPAPAVLAEGFTDRGVIAQIGAPETTQLRLSER